MDLVFICFLIAIVNSLPSIAAKGSEGDKRNILNLPKSGDLLQQLNLTFPTLKSSAFSNDEEYDLTPCTCGIFLSGDYKKGSQPQGNPAIVSESEDSFPCSPAGQKLCRNTCLDLIAKHLSNSAALLCGSIDRDVNRERATLFVKNCTPKWTNTLLSAGREYCCKDGKALKCGI